MRVTKRADSAYIPTEDITTVKIERIKDMSSFDLIENSKEKKTDCEKRLLCKKIEDGELSDISGGDMFGPVHKRMCPLCGVIFTAFDRGELYNAYNYHVKKYHPDHWTD